MLTATTFQVAVDLSDLDRGVFVQERLTLALHPSETPAHLLARLLAWALEHTEGIGFSPGVCAGDEPAVWVHDLTGRRTVWVDVGTPDPRRLQQAARQCDRVAVYCHKPHAAWLTDLHATAAGDKARLHVFALDRDLIAGLERALTRRTTLALTVTEGTVYARCNDVDVDGTVTPLPWP